MSVFTIVCTHLICVILAVAFTTAYDQWLHARKMRRVDENTRAFVDATISFMRDDIYDLMRHRHTTNHEWFDGFIDGSEHDD